MPALVTCRGTSMETQWNVGSDDFVLPAIFVVPLSSFCSILVVASLIALHLSPDCSEGQGLPLFLYVSLVAILTIEIFTIIIEIIIATISYRGTIWNTRKRDSVIPKFIYCRLTLLFLEFIVVVLCLVASLNQNLIRPIDCNSQRVAVALARTSALVIFIKVLGSLVRMLFYLDPCGLFTPGLLQHFSFLDTADEHGEVPEHLLPQSSSPFMAFRRPNFTEKEAAAAAAAAAAGGMSTVTSQLSGTRLSSSGVFAGQPRRTPNIVRFWQRQRSLAHVIRGGYTLDDIDEQAVGQVRNNHIGLRKIQRRLRILCCCLGVGGQRSRGLALEDVARALYTLFDFDDDDGEEEGGGGGGGGVRLVLSDVIAGFRLLNQYQMRKMQRLEDEERLEDKFRKVTFEAMPANQRPHYQYKKPKQLTYDQPELHLLVDNMVHYMHHSMGVYGWSLQVFSNPGCGLCQLASKSRCRCGCLASRQRSSGREEKGVEDEEARSGRRRSMCMVAAMRVQTGVEDDDILHLSMDDEIFKAPFAVVLDRKMESVVVIIRGTLSIKDALTDMSYTMQFVEIPGVHETYVHQGMYGAAVEVRQKLLGWTRQEMRQKIPHTDEIELDRLMENQEKILPKIFQKHKDYQLIVTGHSLGAGVASVLALLLRRDFPDLHCYAFSPPGCVFSYPLARYSKKFTTSMLLGNDVVPRISFRSLLYLKQSVKYLLQNCQKSKFDVLFLPNKHSHRSDREKGEEEGEVERHREAQRTKSTYSLPENFESLIVSKDTTDEKLQNAVFPLTHVRLTNTNTTQPPSFMETNSRQASMDFLDNPVAFEREFKEHVKNPQGQFMPTFPPGKMYHLRVNKSASPCCFGYCYPNQLELERVRNEDLCIIMIDQGAVEDHLPNHVLDSLVMFKEQALSESYEESKVTKLRDDAKEERQQRRRARAQTNTQKGWIFPTTVASTPTDQYGTQASTNSSTISSTNATPDSSSTYYLSRASSVADSTITTTTAENTRRQRSEVNALADIPEADEMCGAYPEATNDAAIESKGLELVGKQTTIEVEVYDEDEEQEEDKEEERGRQWRDPDNDDMVSEAGDREGEMDGGGAVEQEDIMEVVPVRGEVKRITLTEEEEEVKRPSTIQLRERQFPAPLKPDAISPPFLGKPCRTPETPPAVLPVRVPYTTVAITTTPSQGSLSTAMTPLPSFLRSPPEQPISLPAGPLTESLTPPSSPSSQQPISLPNPVPTQSPLSPRIMAGPPWLSQRTRRRRRSSGSRSNRRNRPSIPFLQRFNNSGYLEGGGGGGTRVVTVKPRRGPKLKLIIPAPQAVVATETAKVEETHNTHL